MRKHRERASEPRKAAGERRTARRPWQRILSFLCLAGFLAFFVPVFGGILGLVNLCAMLGFLALAAAFWFWPDFLRLLRWFWKRLWGRILLLITGVGAAALLILLAVLSGMVIGKLRAKPESECPAVIVLGCQVRGENPSLLLWHRIQTAADYLQAHPDAVAVVSGGQGPGEGITEAECMARGLIARGIAPERIRKEERASVTLENLRFSRAILDSEGIPGPALIVSNDFHICRALIMAEDEGMDAQALAAPSAWYSYPTYILREALALVKYGVFG